MNKMAELIDSLAEENGLNFTNLPNVFVFKETQYRSPTPVCYEKGIIIVGQGKKAMQLEGKVLQYNPDNYLVLSVQIPAECEVFASKEEPFLSVAISIDTSDLSRILDKMENHDQNSYFSHDTKQPGLFVSQTTPELKESVIRLLQVLKSPVESDVLGPGIVNEILYRVMCSENASALYSLLVKNSNISKIDKAIKQIHNNFARPISVDELAGLVNMSPSSFHRAFKAVTASSPIQYIKKIRLDKARLLFIEKGIRVGEAASAVGYESATQFSREFKRYFGESPTDFLNLRS